MRDADDIKRQLQCLRSKYPRYWSVERVPNLRAPPLYCFISSTDLTISRCYCGASPVGCLFAFTCPQNVPDLEESRDR